MSDFNDKSTDAMFSRILARLDSQDNAAEERKTDLQKTITALTDEVKDLRTKLETRVASLENWRANVKGSVAVISILIGGATAAIFEAVVSIIKDRHS